MREVTIMPTSSTQSQRQMKQFLKHQTGIAIHWSSEEQAILEDCLVRYSSEPSLSRYEKIASELQNKTVRDVAMRCRWMNTKENNKRRKEDHKGSGRVMVDNKDIIDMEVASNSVLHLFFAPSPPLLTEEDAITIELLKQNEQFLNQISANLTSSRLTENLTLFYKSGENISKILKNLNENVPETMKHIPPLSDVLAATQSFLSQIYHE